MMILSNAWPPKSTFAFLLLMQLFVGNVGFAADVKILENFESDKEGAFPLKWRAKSSEGQKIYRVEAEASNRFLHAQSHNQAVQIALEHIIDPKSQRRLAWRWRVQTFPVGADERLADKHDAAAQVYVIFDNQYWPRVIKYIWSAALPAGSRFSHPLYGRGYVAVVRNGSAGKNKWYSEESNFYDGYRTFFGTEPGKVQGIAILTSSDSTKSSASADYDDFELLP